MKEKQNKSVKHFGEPGMSSRAIYRNQKARFLNLKLSRKIMLFSAFIVIGGFLAFLIDKNILAGAGIGAIVASLLTLFIIAPNSLIIVPMLVFYFSVSLPIVLSYTTYASKGTIALTDTEIGWNLFALCLAGLVATWLTLQYSRGKAWLTLALTLSSTFTLGYLLLTLMPVFGLYNAYISMALILAVRCGGWAWITGLVSIGVSKIKNQKLKVSSLEEKKILGNWIKQSSDEQLIASTLEGLNSSYTIFHDMKINRKHSSIQHLIIGPSGVSILSSVKAEGPITENKAKGVQIPGVDLNLKAAELLTQRQLLSKKLKTNESNISIYIVVMSNKKVEVEKDLRKTLAVFRDNDGAIPSDYITIISLDAIVKEIDNGFALISSITQNMMVQRAKMHLIPAGIPTPARLVSDDRILLAAVDSEGNVSRPEKSPTFLWVKDGVQINIQTNAGMLQNLRVVGESFADEYGRVMAQVCVNEEWLQATMTGRKPVTYAYPVSAMVPLNNM